MSSLMIGAALTEVLGQTQVISSHPGSEFNNTFRQIVNPMFGTIAANNASLENQGPSVTPDLQRNDAFTPG